MAKQSLVGVCKLCDVRKGKVAIATHLKTCLASHANGLQTVPVVLLRVQSADPHFWLHIAAGREAKLGQLDGLLRAVWLECCGHLSEFYAGRHDEISMDASVAQVVGSTGDWINYVYDFGSSTELSVSFAGLAEGTSRKPIVVARNEAPVWPCEVCGAAATTLCSEYEHSEDGFCCDKHAGDHECGEDMMLPVVNSPRMGVCGYSG